MKTLTQKDVDNLPIPTNIKALIGEMKANPRAAQGIVDDQLKEAGEHPAIQAYNKKVARAQHAGRMPKVSSVGDLIAQKALAMAQSAKCGKADHQSKIWVNHQLRSAVPYYWGKDCIGELVRQLRDEEFPDHTVNIRTVMPFDCIFMYFEYELVADNGTKAWGIMLNHYADEDDNMLRCVLFHADGQMSAQVFDFERDTFSQLTPAGKSAIGMLNFLNQTITQVEHRRPDKKMRRKMKHPEIRDISDGAHWVSLRRIDNQGQSNGDGSFKYDKWRWKVSGHWRKQWYAKDKAHRLIWIDNFEKGPPNAPLKPPAYHVNR